MALSVMFRPNRWQYTGLQLILVRTRELSVNHKRYFGNSVSLFSEVSSRPIPKTNRTEKSSIPSTSASDDSNTFGSLKDTFIEPSRWKKRQTAASTLKAFKKAVPGPKNASSISQVASFKFRNGVGPNNPDTNPRQRLDEADVFGKLDSAPETQTDDLPTLDEGDRMEEEFLSRKPQLWRTTADISRQMKALIREKKLGEALSLLEEMTTNARIKPDAYMHNVLIGGCGRAGYTKMAFKLYRKMKDRQLKPNAATYTGLFNACANSPWPEDGLNRATKLYQEICEKGIALNNKNYHAAIKAFGRCGDLQRAFRMVDVMQQNGVGITCETFNFLLSGCVSDSATGFLQAIRVWRKMREKKIQPDIYSYNLLMRTVRDCHMGDPQITEKLLLPQLANLKTGNSNSFEITSNINKTDAGSTDNSIVLINQTSPQFPDLLSPNETVTSVIGLREAVTPQDRLLMLGGMVGILHRMKKDNVRPQIKTFTALLELIPSNREAEEQLLTAINDRGVSPDIDFFNVLIKRRNCRNDFNAAKDVLDLIAKHSLHVDIATFGTLAMGCAKWDDAKCLLNDMEEAGFRVNIQIVGALVHNACGRKNFWYLIDILKLMQSEAIPACPKLLTNVENCITSTKELIVKKEKEGITFNDDDKFIKSFKVFLLYYKTWLKSVDVQLQDHPWQAYRTIPSKNEDNI